MAEENILVATSDSEPSAFFITFPSAGILMDGPELVPNWSSPASSEALNFFLATTRAMPLDSSFVALPLLFPLEAIAPPALEMPSNVFWAISAVCRTSTQTNWNAIMINEEHDATKVTHVFC